MFEHKKENMDSLKLRRGSRDMDLAYLLHNVRKLGSKFGLTEGGDDSDLLNRIRRDLNNPKKVGTSPMQIDECKIPTKRFSADGSDFNLMNRIRQDLNSNNGRIVDLPEICDYPCQLDSNDRQSYEVVYFPFMLQTSSHNHNEYSSQKSSSSAADVSEENVVPINISPHLATQHESKGVL